MNSCIRERRENWIREKVVEGKKERIWDGERMRRE
jgi:hypothetical protein